MEAIISSRNVAILGLLLRVNFLGINADTPRKLCPLNQVRTGRVIFVVVADCRRAIVVILLPFRDMPELDFAEIIDLICKEDSRFAKKAYDFVRQGLDHTVKELRKKQGKEVDRSFHVTGPQLLEGMRIYSLDQYGPMTLGSGQTPLGQEVRVSTPGAKTQYDSGPVSGITREKNKSPVFVRHNKTTVTHTVNQIPLSCAM